jgi:hypothetical protein
MFMECHGLILKSKSITAKVAKNFAENRKEKKAKFIILWYFALLIVIGTCDSLRLKIYSLLIP